MNSSLELNNKVDKVVGKDLSTNDFGNAEKTKLASLQNFSKDYNELTNTPTIPSITNLATKTELNNGLDTKANLSHLQEISTIINLQTALDNRYPKNETMSKEAIQILFNTVSKNMNWKEPIDTYVHLQALTGMVDGEAHVVTENSTIYIYSNSTWVSLGSSSSVPMATELIDGLLSKEDKIKLNAIVVANIITTTKLADELAKYTDTTTLEANYATITSVSAKANSSDVYTQTQTDNLLGNKVDKVANKSLIADSEITRLATVTNYDHTNVDNHIANNNIHVTSTDKTNLATVVASSHTHSNKAVIDKFTEVSGQPYYNGSAIGGGTGTSVTINDTSTSSTTETYSIDKIKSLISSVKGFEVVSTLPISPSSDKIYILSSQNYSMNYYDGSTWVTLGGNQIVIGTTNTDTTKLWLDTTSTTSPMLKWHNGTTWINISGSSTGGHIIQDSITTFTQRKNLKFTSDNVTITDDPTNDTTLIDIVGGSGGFLNVKGLGMTIADGGSEAIISFTNPASDNIDKVYLYVSYLEDLSNQAYDYVSTHATLLKDNFPITNGVSNTFNLPITDSNRNKSCYVRMYVGYGGTDYSSGASINQVLSDVTPTSPVTNISVTQLTKSSVKLNWTNPTETDLKNVNVLMKYDTAINDIYDGTIIYTGSSNTCTITGLEEGKHVYFRLYTLDKSDNIQSDSSQVIDIQLDNIAPNEATLFTVLSGFSICKLKFADSSSIDWKMSKIIRKVGSEPTSIDDGTLVLTNTTKDSYKNNYFIDGGLSNGLSYFYKIYSIDNFGNVSSGVSQVGNPVATALPEVSNFKIENIENGTKQKISWTNSFAPSGLTYVARQLFYSKDQTVALDTMTRDQCIAEPLISSLTLGVGTGQGLDDNFTTSTLIMGDISRYKVFINYDSSGTPIWSSGTYDIKEVKDETPLTDVTGLITTAEDTQNTISWFNPNTSLDSDFAKVQIFRKVGTYPDGNNDLEKVYESTNQNSGNLNTFVDSSLANNTIYYYLIKLIDTSGNVNVNTKFTLTPILLPILSVSYQPSTDTWNRGGINTGKTPEDLWSVYPYNSIKRILFDGTTVSYLKADDSTKLENSTNADLTINMYSRIPKFYYKYSYADGKHTWSIAETQLSGFTLFPAFIRSSANKDYIDIGCFKGSVDGTNKLESKNGKTPNIDKAFSDYRTYAKNIGTNYNQFDALSQSVLDLLFIIQYATGNVQSVFTGIDDTVKTNGQTLSLGNRNGVVNGTLSLYGVESVFGNGQYSICDGLKATSTGYYLADDNFASMTSESTLGNYTKVGSIVPTTTSGFIKDIEQVGSLFLGKDNIGSSTSGFGDMQYSVSESGLNVLLIGGDIGIQSGLFNNSFVNVSNLSKTLTMTNEGNIDTYTTWSVSLDKTNLNTAFKSIGSFTLIDGTNPSITVNQTISAKLNGRIIHYN